MSEALERHYRRVVTASAGAPRARRALLLLGVLVREMVRDQVAVRAATLAYWSLVTIVPVLVVIAAIMQPLTPPGSMPFHRIALGALLAGPVRGVGTQVEEWLSAIDLGKVGVFGLVGVLFMSSRIWFSVEDAYNALWNTRPRRSLAMRLTLFYTTLTLAPLLITVGFQLTHQVDEHMGVSWSAVLAPVLLTTLAFVGGIKALPDTDVRWVPALVGGLASAVAFEAAKYGFGLYTRLLGAEDAAAKIYGSLGLFPVFLLWLFLLWLIVLFGVELAYVVQRRADLLAAEERRFQDEAGVRHADALFALQCLFVVAERYAAGLGPTAEPAVTGILASDPTHCKIALETLEAAGVLAEAPTGYLPALPLEQLTVREVLVRYRAQTQPSLSNKAPGTEVVAALLAPGVGRLEAPISELLRGPAAQGN